MRPYPGYLLTIDWDDYLRREFDERRAFILGECLP